MNSQQSLRAYAFFSGFSDELLLQVAAKLRSVQFSPGQVVLQEGQSNDSLYILRSGELQISLQGELLTRLQTPGEVLGEMSLISRQPVSATVQALTPVDFYVIDAQDFSRVSPQEQEHLQFLLYKIYSSIVTERLRQTNYKARQAEINNRELILAQGALEAMNANLEQLIAERTHQLQSSYLTLESQNAALVTGFKKLSEQSQTRDHTLARLRHLQTHEIQPLLKILPGAQPQDLALIKSSNFRVGEQLKTLIDFLQSETAVNAKKVLLLEAEKKQQLIAKMAFGGSGVTLDIASDVSSAHAYLQNGTYDLIVCDVALHAFLQEAHSQGCRIPMVVFTGEDIQVYIKSLRALPFVNYVVSRNPADRNLTVKTILTTTNKILSQDFFGLEKYLTWGVDVREHKIHASAERAECISTMQQDFKKIGVRSTLLERCALVAEEMLMNAIYDAPVDAQGKSLYNHLPRSAEVHLSPDQAATLRYACDGNGLAISVSDPFGVLTKKIIFDYLESCYSGQAGILNQNKGGAGRGLHQIIENSDLTVFNVRSRICTEVICLLNIDNSTQPIVDASPQGPHFHYFFF